MYSLHTFENYIHAALLGTLLLSLSKKLKYVTPFFFLLFTDCPLQLPRIMGSVRYGHKPVTMELSHTGAMFPPVMIIFMLSQAPALFPVSEGTARSSL